MNADLSKQNEYLDLRRLMKNSHVEDAFNKWRLRMGSVWFQN